MSDSVEPVFKTTFSVATSLGMGILPFCPEVGAPLALFGSIGSAVMSVFGLVDGDADDPEKQTTDAITNATQKIDDNVNAVGARIQNEMDKDFLNEYWAPVHAVQAGLNSILDSFDKKMTDGSLTWLNTNTTTGQPYYLAVVRGQLVGTDDAVLGMNSPILDAIYFAQSQDDGTHKSMDLVLNACVVYLTAAKLFASLEYWYANNTRKPGAPLPVIRDIYLTADGSSYTAANLEKFMAWITPRVAKINMDMLYQNLLVLNRDPSLLQPATGSSPRATLLQFVNAKAYANTYGDWTTYGTAATPLVVPADDPLAIFWAAQLRYAYNDCSLTDLDGEGIDPVSNDVAFLGTNATVLAMNSVYNLLVKTQADYMQNVMGQTAFTCAPLFPETDTPPPA